MMGGKPGLLLGVVSVLVSTMSIANAAYPDIDLATFTSGSTGFRMIGSASSDHYSGACGVGDVNGDGLDDVIMSAYGANPSGRNNAGAAMVVYGNSTATAFTEVDPNTFAFGTNGFEIYGAVAGDNILAVAAGDVNGDGLGDIIAGAENVDPGGVVNAGAAWVIFGRPASNPFPAAIDLLTFSSGTAGFKIVGGTAGDFLATTIGGIGDVNGDGYDEVIVSAYGARPFNRAGAGAAYIIFGHNSSIPFTNLTAGAFASTDEGITIFGAKASDHLAGTWSGGGDVNGDGIDDIVVTAPFADPSSRVQAGVVYIIYGHTGAFTNIDLFSFPSSAAVGFTISGQQANAFDSYYVDIGGDFNHDGCDDLILGAHLATPSGNTAAGWATVIFGRRGTPGSIDMVNGVPSSSLGFRIYSLVAGDNLGVSVSIVRDVTMDGIDDILVSASGADAFGRTDCGMVMVLVGHSNKTAFPDIYAQDALGELGYKIYGALAGDKLSSVAAAGDVNGDGKADFAVSANSATVGARTGTGAGYVIFGSYPPPTPTPSTRPTSQPSSQPSRQPSRQPTSKPSVPTSQPSRQPSCQPSQQPTSRPTRKPSSQPSAQPSNQPSARPSRQPTIQPSCLPSRQPSVQPSVQPSALPTCKPTCQPSCQPSLHPSTQPTNQPSGKPTSQPSHRPSSVPSSQPSKQPSSQPSARPTRRPSVQPSGQPSAGPNAEPTAKPSSQPSSVPSAQPFEVPSGQPSSQPSAFPSAQPSRQPSAQPSSQPSSQPSTRPTAKPSTPTAKPTVSPSSAPTISAAHYARLLSSSTYKTNNGFAFAVMASDGSVHTWGEAPHGGDSTAVVANLGSNITAMVSSRFAFAAIDSAGRVVAAWGPADEVRGSSLLAETVVHHLVANEAAFAGIDQATGGVVAFGSASSGGDVLHDSKCNGYSVQLSAGVTSIAASAAAFAAVKSDGTVYAWGHPYAGAGVSSETMPQLAGVSKVVATREAFAALLSTGRVVSWGGEYAGGDSSAAASELQSGVVHIVASSAAFVAIKSDLRAVPWGYGPWGGDASAVTDQLTQVVYIAHTPVAFAVVRSDGSVVAWGDADSGGDSSEVQAQLVNVEIIYGNSKAFAALTSAGKVVTWGKAAYGGQIPSYKVSALSSGVVSIYHTDRAFAALKTGGTVVVWGQAGHGGSPGAAVEAHLVSGVHTICANDVAFSVIKTDGSVVGWGHPASIPTAGFIGRNVSLTLPGLCA